MDCKKALVEAEGNIDDAIGILRKKGQKIAEKRADRDSSEGAVVSQINDAKTRGVVVSLNCETDFVANNDSYSAMAREMAAIAINYDSKEAFLAAAFNTEMTVAEKLIEQTGVIGEKLPIEKIIKHLPQAVRSLDMNGWQDAAWGILTTDTCPKGASVQIQHQGQTINLSGISKGSGMIRPNMATMLAFVATDATCSQGLIQQLLTQSVNHSFNRITVDGDMSTNDSCILMASN